MTVLFVVLAIGVLTAVIVLIVRDRPIITDDNTTAPAFAWPPGRSLAPADLDVVRFAVAVRGYRMDQVDRVLDDARSALAARDDRIGTLEKAVLAMRARPTPTRPDGGLGQRGAEGLAGPVSFAVAVPEAPEVPDVQAEPEAPVVPPEPGTPDTEPEALNVPAEPEARDVDTEPVTQDVQAGKGADTPEVDPRAVDPGATGSRDENPPAVGPPAT